MSILKGKFCLNPKNKDRCYDAIKAIFVAILITTGSTTITYYSNQLNQKKQIFMDSRKEALGIAKKMTNKMNDRYLYALRVVVSYHWNIDQDQRYIEYDNSVKRWNDELITNLSDVKRYFGEETRGEIYQIIKKFNRIHQVVMRMRASYVTKQPIVGTEELLDEVYKMDDVITNFADGLQKQLQEGEVDIYRTSPPLTQPTKAEKINE